MNHATIGEPSVSDKQIRFGRERSIEEAVNLSPPRLVQQRCTHPSLGSGTRQQDPAHRWRTGRSAELTRW